MKLIHACRSILASWVAVSLIAQAGPDVTGGVPEPKAAVVPPGEFRGTVTYTGPLLKPIEVPEAGSKRDPIEVDRATKGLKDAVVWIEGVAAAGRVVDAAERKPVVMDQINFAFAPHVLSIDAGTPVEFTNSDSANHGVTASSLEGRNGFNVVTPAGGRYTHRFVASKHPVAIGCPFHASMAASLYVFDHPYHAVTGAKGRFRILGVPPGRYTLHVRHRDGGMTRRMEIVVGGEEVAEAVIVFGKADLKAKDLATPSR